MEAKKGRRMEKWRWNEGLWNVILLKENLLLLGMIETLSWWTTKQSMMCGVSSCMCIWSLTCPSTLLGSDNKHVILFTNQVFFNCIYIKVARWAGWEISKMGSGRNGSGTTNTPFVLTLYKYLMCFIWFQKQYNNSLNLWIKHFSRMCSKTDLIHLYVMGPKLPPLWLYPTYIIFLCHAGFPLSYQQR